MVMGTEKPADMITNHLLREALDKCMGHLNQWRMQVRARAGLDIQGKKKVAGTREEPKEVVGKVESTTSPFVRPTDWI